VSQPVGFDTITAPALFCGIANGTNLRRNVRFQGSHFAEQSTVTLSRAAVRHQLDLDKRTT
jgi:hypothetical protein